MISLAACRSPWIAPGDCATLPDSSARITTVTGCAPANGLPACAAACADGVPAQASRTTRTVPASARGQRQRVMRGNDRSCADGPDAIGLTPRYQKLNSAAEPDDHVYR